MACERKYANFLLENQQIMATRQMDPLDRLPFFRALIDRLNWREIHRPKLCPNVLRPKHPVNSICAQNDIDQQRAEHREKQHPSKSTSSI
jgi:hypothetical protein